MLSSKQCQLARTITSDTTSDTKINSEFKAMAIENKLSAAKAIDDLLKAHDLPIEQGFKIMTSDFILISKTYGISPATLFCIYMDYKSLTI